MKGNWGFILLLVTGMQVYAQIDETFYNQVEAEVHLVGEEGVVASPEIIKSFVRDVNAVQQLGSLEQKQNLQEILSINKEQIHQQLSQQIKRFLLSPELRKSLSLIFQNALKGAAVPLIIAGAQYLSGQMPALFAGDTSELELAMVQGATLSIFAQLNGLLIEGKVSDEITPLDYAQFNIVQILQKQATIFVLPQTAILNEVTNIITTGIDQLGGIPKLLKIQTPLKQKRFGRQVIFGEKKSKYRKPIETLAARLKSVFKDKKTREAVAHVLFNALQGAAISGVLFFLGISFVEEATLLATLGGSMLRGAVMGLVEYTLNKSGQMGALQGSSSYAMIRYVQKVVQLGSPELAVTDIAPAVVKQLVGRAVETTVNQMGGWQATADVLGSAVTKGTESRLGGWYRSTRQKAGQKVTGFFNWLKEDLDKSAGYI